MNAAPSAERIWRIDLRTAPRKAALAFSIRCQRSATWRAWGSALLVASAKPPPQSRVNRDLRLSGEPRLGRRRLPVGKELDRATALEITNNRPIALLALPGPVIDPDDVWSWRRRPARSPNHPQQRVVAYRHHKTPCQARRRSATERKRQMVDEPRGAQFDERGAQSSSSRRSKSCRLATLAKRSQKDAEISSLH
jgi:hypothetical protein